MDKRFDQQPDAVAAAYLIPYTQHVDSLMNPLVGRTAEYLDREIDGKTVGTITAEVVDRRADGGIRLAGEDRRRGFCHV